MRLMFSLYAAFFRIGLFTFGGGYSMLPMLEREVVDKHAWATQEQLLDYFAIGQCTPGVIAVNTATLVGCQQAGAIGAAFATLGVITPSLIIISVIAAVLSRFAHIPVVIHAFAGIRVAVCALILSAVVKLFKSNVLQKDTSAGGAKAFLLRNAAPFLLCAAAFALVALLEASPIYAVVGAAIFGLLFYRKRGEG